MLCCAVGLSVLSVCSSGAQQISQTVLDKGAQLVQGVDVLSDTQGANLQPYLKGVLHQIYEQWTPLIPADAQPPASRQGMTQIRLTIHRDGSIAAMRLDASTYDNALNHAAWAAIKGVGQLSPLPREFHGSNLELRIHFLVNQSEE